MGSFSVSVSVARRRLIAVSLLAVVLLVVVWRHAAHGSGGGAGAPLQVAPLAGTPSGGGGDPALSSPSPVLPVRSAGELVVDVVGAVRHPGVYRLARGDRVQDAVARAGGLTPRADPVAVNLAAPVADGEQIVVAARGSGAGAAASGSGAPGAGAPVSLSSATVEQLDALPGVGPVTAQKIVEYRQQHGAFTSVDELDAIPGIGPSRLHDLEPLVVP